jgi:hypothetical protein
MKIEVLVLEDTKERMRYFKMYCPSLVHEETAKGCIEKLTEAEEIQELWLDHDLGNETYVDSSREDCGMEVVRFLQKNDLKHKIKTIYVHSHNKYANIPMNTALQDAGYNSILHPFYKLKEAL